MYKKNRIADLKDIPQDVMEGLAKIDSDLGMGENGRNVLSKYKTEEKTEKKEKTLKRKKRSAFNSINYDR